MKSAALAPLRQPVFRGLWLAWLAANLTMWMNDVAAAWLMTSLTTSPVMVALVLAGLSLAGALTAPLLLALTFVNGVGLAMRWPVFAAIVPQIVARPQLPAALALNGIAMNLSRVVGPVAAGALLAAASPAAVFVVNAVLALAAFVLILRWRSVPQARALPGERFVGAMRAGLNFALQSPRLQVILLRIFLFFLQSTALMALLPLVALRLHGGGPGTFTVMISCVGLGAVIAALFFPRWRERFGRDTFVRAGTWVHAAMSALVVSVPEVWVALPAMVVAGMAWISVANSLTVAAQVALPDWVRARGMAIYQMALMGGAAAGSLLWGQAAAWIGVDGAVMAAGAAGIVLLLATRRLSVEGSSDPDYTPAPVGNLPDVAVPVDADEGPVMVTIEYLVDPARAAAFSAVMERTRRARLRQGALSWGLFRDTSRPGRYVEYFVDENWVEHQRRLERFSRFDADLRSERLGFHLGPEAPVVRRYVADGGTSAPGL